jgi:glycosyltransferase involved in cell wall biosynthesis
LPSGAPKVSVIVPTFNRPGPLLEALRSILNQTCQDFEIIVVNDAGLDVGEVVTALAPPGQIAYLRHTRNQDRAAARNTALRAARGKYVAYLDDDDLFYPDHLESLIALAESGGHQVVYSDAYRAVQKREGAGNHTVVRDLPHSSDFDYDQILVNNQIPLLCVLHERACVHQVGLFDESLGTHEDWDYWIRMSRRFRFAHLKKVTCEFRWCEDGSTTSSARRADFLRTTAIIHDRYKRHAAGNSLILQDQQVMMQALRHELALLPAEDRETPQDRPGGEEMPWNKRPRMKMAFPAEPPALDKAPGELQESA